jgi:hypothetical protein
LAIFFSDVEVVALLATLLVVAYFIGTYWKHRTLTSYAHWFEERFSRRATVKYKSFGHAGLRIRCEMNNTTDGFKDLEFALTLGARENLIYYPYAVIAKDFDKLNCWGALIEPAKFQVTIAKMRKKMALTWDTAGLEEVKIPELHELGYTVYSTGPDYATQFVRRTGAAARLKDLESVELLELEQDPSRLHLATRLRKDELPRLMDFLSLLGRSV